MDGHPLAQQPLGIGLIGAGNILKRHASAHRGFPHLARLIAIADIDAKRAEEARKTYGFAAAHTDYHELLNRKDVEVIDICTPANLHAKMAIDAIEAGKHVLCEKPMATSLAEADRIIAAAEAHPKQAVCFVFQLRAEAAHRRMRLMIEQGQIGKPVTANVTVRIRKKASYYEGASARGTWAGDGGGVLINQAIHQLDAMISFLGEPVQASAVMDTFVQPTEAEDTLVGWVKFAGGAVAAVSCTLCAQNKSFLIEVLGENASMAIGGDPDGHKFDWQVRVPGSAARNAMRATGMKLSPSPRDPKGLPLAIGKLSAKLKKREWVPPNHWGHAPFVGEFLTAIRDGRPVPVPPREGRRSLELAAALYESAIAGRVVNLPVSQDSCVYGGVKPDHVKSSGADRCVKERAAAFRDCSVGPTLQSV